MSRAWHLLHAMFFSWEYHPKKQGVSAISQKSLRNEHEQSELEPVLRRHAVMHACALAIHVS